MNSAVFLVLIVALANAHANSYTDSIQQFIDDNFAAIHANEGDRVADFLGGAAFPCNVTSSASTPLSVHQLRPSDIKVVAAVGDSVTAGFGAEATSLLNLVNEWRGVSWSIGGDDDLSQLITLPNILKAFNATVTGFSIGKSGPDTPQAANNVAVSGAIAQDIMGQVESLITLLQKDADSFANDWKVVTLWIGGNDLCRVCNNFPENVPEAYAEYVYQALLKIVTVIPRVYVNLVNIIDVTKLAELTTFSCQLIQTQTCKCVADKSQRAAVQTAALDYQNLLVQVAQRPELHGDTFTVELQPFFVDAPIPTINGKPDTSYLAPDCFHFATKLHEVAASALWNNMLQAPNAKATAWNFTNPINCPTAAAPYLCTSTNNCGANGAVTPSL